MSTSHKFAAAALASVSSILFPLQASADIVTVTVTGTISMQTFQNIFTGTDNAGYFGPAGASLFGDSFTVVWTFDTNCACANVSPSAISGGSLYGTPSPVVNAVLTLTATVCSTVAHLGSDASQSARGWTPDVGGAAPPHSMRQSSSSSRRHHAAQGGKTAASSMMRTPTEALPLNGKPNFLAYTDYPFLRLAQFICEATPPGRRHQQRVVKGGFAASPSGLGSVLALRQVDDLYPAFDGPFKAFAHERSHNAVLAPIQIITGKVQIQLVAEQERHPGCKHLAVDLDLEYAQLVAFRHQPGDIRNKGAIRRFREQVLMPGRILELGPLRMQGKQAFKRYRDIFGPRDCTKGKSVTVPSKMLVTFAYGSLHVG